MQPFLLALVVGFSSTLPFTPAARLELRVTPDGEKAITKNIALPATDGDRHAFVTLARNERTLLQVHVDSYDGWHEVSLTNGSIEHPSSHWRGDYEVRLVSTESEEWRVTRRGAEFFDGTGYLEILGTPRLTVESDAARWYYRDLHALLKQHRDPYLALVRQAPTPGGLEGYPHRDQFDPANWHSTRFDGAYSTHSTGSPSVRGVVDPFGARLVALRSSNVEGDRVLASHYRDALWGKVGQQCRRPLHFFHDDDGSVWRANEWPKLVMGEWGPALLWGASETWGREKNPPRGAWNGWDLEHLEIDTQAMAWLLFGSRFALREMRHKLEGVLTHPYLKESRETSPRMYGLSLKALAVGAVIDPDPKRAARYRAGADFLIGYWSDHYRTVPRISVQSSRVLGDGRHLMPSIAEIRAYFRWAGWPWIEEDAILARGSTAAPGSRTRAEFDQSPLGGWSREMNALAARRAELVQLGANVSSATRQRAEYEVGEAEKRVVRALAAYVGATHGSKARWEMERLWGFVACFQVGTIAAGFHAYADAIGSDDTIRDEARDLLAYFMLEARNRSPGGTFWYDTAVWLPQRNVGSGRETEGVTEWVAGGLGMLRTWVPPAARIEWKDAVDSVYRRSRNASPAARLSSFESWFLPYAVDHGLP